MRKKLLSFLLALLCFAMTGKTQVLSLSGRILDEKGAPIPFVSIVLKGKKSSGTTSDLEGRFKLPAAKGDVLVVSGVGYVTKEVAVGANAALEIMLTSGKTDLSEVVVTAMGIRRSEKALGYAVSKVDPSTMLQKSEPNILNTLAGKVPGVDIRAGQGAPGAASRIQIRGVSSFGGGDPLIVVDGVPYSNPIVNTSNPFSGGGTYGSGINNIDPNDIESISVLKGAAAASLYGSRAANGVLLITTKSGSPKKGAKSLNVTYRAGYSIEKIADIPEFQNLYGAGANFRVGSSNGSWGGRFGRGVVYDLNGNVIGTSASGIDSIPANTWATMYASYPELFPNARIAYKAVPDNVSALFNNGNMMEHSVGLNGGEGRSLFNATLSHVDQNGYITNSSYRKSNVSVGGQTAVGKLTIGANASYARSKQVGGFIGAAQSFLSQWGRTYTMARNWDIAGWPTESKSGQQIGFNDGQYTNPIWGAYHNVITSIDERMVATIRVSYKFNNWIRLDFNGGLNSYALFRDQIIDKSSYGSSDNTLGNITEVVNRQQEIQGKIVAVISPKIHKDWTLDINLGSDVNERNARSQQVYGVDFVITGQYNLFNTRRQTFANDSRSKRRLVGFFGDASLGYKNFAFLNLTGRADLTSTLPYANAQYFYPGASASLVWSEALGLKSKWLDYGKLRVGYARVGNDAAPHNGAPIFNLNAAGFLNQPFATKGTSIYDTLLTPEFTTELEVGTDMRFFNQRLGVEVTWYDKTSTDLIYNLSMPSTSGYTAYYTNLGKIRNKGWEIALDVNPVRTKNFSWDIRGIYTQNANTVEELKEGLLRSQLGGFNWVEAGKPFGYLRGSYSARSDDGQLLIHPISGMPLVDPNDGMVGDPNADYKFGITNTFTYKGFTLNVLFDATIGGDFYSETINSMLGRGVTKDTEIREKNAVITGIYGNTTPVTGADGLNHFTPMLVGGKTVPNQTRVTTNDLFFTAGTGASFATNGAFEYAVFDGTVYRLRELSLGYSLPTSWVSKLRLSAVNLSVSGRNLWYLAPNVPKYTHFDPDINSVVGSGTQGVETGGAPSTKRYGVNLSVTF
ncbi:SusC/RagA family TonB-linked outer membrane protein [Paraflavitalea sp. CAU 1676]|uniref:SusC/RagA family TonB-linked outer membrane protein n=1 Tax=Paraflavitalea sp. CAU 1676 TaxID=3032598 RepID=UPI0023DA5429|nr:SusC/RagA family TonB-linked outer membrane protein [Paraflavitalea sp. CAU 1676]MDF2193213.1 SusC/RagA family TonB-linked outer membrane protein [Paraflavitalea sp. CAU 1676]